MFVDLQSGALFVDLNPVIEAQESFVLVRNNKELPNSLSPMNPMDPMFLGLPCAVKGRMRAKVHRKPNGT